MIELTNYMYPLELMAAILNLNMKDSFSTISKVINEFLVLNLVGLAILNIILAQILHE